MMGLRNKEEEEESLDILFLLITPPIHTVHTSCRYPNDDETS
jgi:hypothetical protein